MSIGVAISTTGDEHRMGLLARCVDAWDKALAFGDSLFVTVDGDAQACARVKAAVAETTTAVFHVGQPTYWWTGITREGRLGVAANKNTGLELLMAVPRIDHLWLSDDDTWPLSLESWALHHRLVDLPHSLVAWGPHRKADLGRTCVSWGWPRGAAMYVTRGVVDEVGGMVEQFGPGGHEHVEWSRRIHKAGLIPAPFVSPREYARDNWMGARRWWHAEDMARPGEPLAMLRRRRDRLTTVRRHPEDVQMQDMLMSKMAVGAPYVPYTARWNHRGSATLVA